MRRKECRGEHCEEPCENNDSNLLAVDGGVWASRGVEWEGVGEDEGDGDEESVEVGVLEEIVDCGGAAVSRRREREECRKLQNL